jgi:hypothetical protein
MANRAHVQKGRHKPKPVPNNHHKHYWPYIPVLLLVVATFALSLLQPVIEKRVLSYATEMSIQQLLDETNAQRTANGVAPLTLNTKLNSAAQSKANDMVTRNYWAHNTPDGQEPWVFFDAAGYKYYKAGENLAYGFATSGATVTGWMNSPSHRDNLLDSAFTEVGFGFKNSENFNDSGPETVVVAEYGRPQVLAQANAGTEQPSAPAPQQAAAPTPSAAQPSTPAAAQPQTANYNTKETGSSLIVNSTNPNSSLAKSVPVSRVASMFGGNTWLVFIVGIMTGAAAVALLIRHALALRHVLGSTERFFLRHPVLDATLVAIILIGTFMLQTNGHIR